MVGIQKRDTYHGTESSEYSVQQPPTDLRKCKVRAPNGQKASNKQFMCLVLLKRLPRVFSSLFFSHIMLSSFIIHRTFMTFDWHCRVWRFPAAPLVRMEHPRGMHTSFPCSKARTTDVNSRLASQPKPRTSGTGTASISCLPFSPLCSTTLPG